MSLRSKYLSKNPHEKNNIIIDNKDNASADMIDTMEIAIDSSSFSGRTIAIGYAIDAKGPAIVTIDANTPWTPNATGS